DQEITWRVSTESDGVCKIDEDGRLVASDTGKCKLTGEAEATEDGKYEKFTFEQTIQVAADLSALEDAVEDGEEIKSEEGDYSAISWDRYKKALDTAKDWLKDDDASQEDINDALTALRDAEDEL